MPWFGWFIQVMMPLRVDVYIDGDLVFANLEYGESSGYGTVPEGGRTVKVVLAGETAPARD